MDRYQRIKEIFEAALEHGPGERGAFLDQACEGDRTLLHEVNELIAADTDAGDFLKPPPAGAPPSFEPYEGLAGTRLDQYLLTRVISSGGMGTVYEAVQEHPRRTVAIKVMRAGIVSRSALRRFEYESEILAKLRHPGIAQVIEAGTVDEGSGAAGIPFFVMEYIPDARAITDYAREKGLNLRDRIALFLQVCDAVHHGHLKSVIHRDLKPSNILVDAQGLVKIIDFGVARATDSDMALTTLQTEVGQLIGTLQYMSPEQCRADPGDLDIRSDVYSLGMVLYELLCEDLPYDVQGTAVLEAARLIQEKDPRKPSTTRRILRGDAETILLKALEKDRGRRYQTAADLGEDLRRFLAGRVILARPVGPATRIYKQIKRNPVMSTSVGVALVALIAFLLYVVFISYPSIKAERDRVKREADKATAVNEFLKDMLASANPDVDGREVKVVEILDQAVEELDGAALAAQPEIEAALRYTVGATYWSLGQYAPAEAQLNRALDIQRRVLGGEHRDTLATASGLAVVLQHLGKFEEAKRLDRGVLETQIRVLGEADEATLVTMNNYAGLLVGLGDFSTAESLLGKALEIHRRVSGEEALATVSCMNAYAICLGQQGKLDEAEPLLREVLEIRRRALGEAHTDTITTMNGLALVLSGRGELEEAERLFLKAYDLQRQVVGEDHPETFAIMSNLAGTLKRQGRFAEAESLLRKGLELRREKMGEEHPGTLLQMNAYAMLFHENGRFPEAEPLLRKCVEIGERVLPEDHLDLGWYYVNHGKCLLEMKRFDDAEARLLKGYDRFQRLAGPRSNDARIAAGCLVHLYEQWGKPDQAERWRPRWQ